jgi:hypothetical protein
VRVWKLGGELKVEGLWLRVVGWDLEIAVFELRVRGLEFRIKGWVGGCGLKVRG